MRLFTLGLFFQKWTVRRVSRDVECARAINHALLHSHFRPRPPQTSRWRDSTDAGIHRNDGNEDALAHGFQDPREYLDCSTACHYCTPRHNCRTQNNESVTRHSCVRSSERRITNRRCNGSLPSAAYSYTPGRDAAEDRQEPCLQPRRTGVVLPFDGCFVNHSGVTISNMRATRCMKVGR